MCTALGIAPAALLSPGGKVSAEKRFSGHVVIIGAGAAGMTAGMWLKKSGARVTILEAGPAPGGRMRTNTSFADFPIPLGAEWLHVSRKIFQELTRSDASVPTTAYTASDPYVEVEGQNIRWGKIGREPDLKFVNSSWYDFFDQFILPMVREDIKTGQVVNRIAEAGDKLLVSTLQGMAVEADRVIVTVPLQMLKEGRIAFDPPLPKSKRRAIASAKPWPGLKLFIEFAEKFYPAFIVHAVSPKTAGHKMYYDAAYGQNSGQNVLGLFTVGAPALPFINGNALEIALADLDEVFDGAASRTYRKHLLQDWTGEPHIRSAYIRDNENYRTVRNLQKPVRGKILFAGEAYTDGEDWGGVHDAARSGIAAVRRMAKDG